MKKIIHPASPNYYKIPVACNLNQIIPSKSTLSTQKGTCERYDKSTIQPQIAFLIPNPASLSIKG